MTLRARSRALRPRIAEAGVVGLLLGTALLAAGCGSGGPSATTAASPTTDVPTPTPTLAPTPTPTVAPTPTVTVGRGTFRLVAPAGATVASSRGDAARRVVVRGTSAQPVEVEIELLTPSDGSFVPQQDGSVAVQVPAADDARAAVGGAHPTVAGLTEPRAGTSVSRGDDATVAVVSDRTLRVTGSENGVALWFGSGAPRSATWTVQEGGRSLAVDASSWARAAGQAGADATWTSVVDAHPDAARPGMYDQLLCHAIGATDKPTWNLEPWRPDVGLVATLAARCNPR